MRAQYRNLLWILAVALLAFQLGFKPLAIAREHTLAELGVATYSFPTEDLLVAVQEARAKPAEEGSATESEAAVESEAAESQPAESEAATESQAGESEAASESQAGESEPAAESEEAAPEEEELPPINSVTDLENEMWTTLDEAGVWVITGGVDVSGSEAEVTFAFPVDTTPAAAREQRRQARDTLAAKYGATIGQPAEQPLSRQDEQDEAAVVAQIWKLQIRKPTPQVKLGLDLQGGTRLVMEAVPVTRYVFVDQSQAVALDDMDIEEEAAEEVAAESDAAPPESEPAIEPEEALDDEPGAAESRDEWEVIAGSLETQLASDKVTVRSLTHTTTGVVLEAMTVDQVEADALRDQVRTFLSNARPGGEIRCTEQESFFIKGDTINRVREIMQRRVDGFGLTEPIIQTQGDRRVIVEIPGTTPESVEETLDKPADLKLMWFDPNRFRIEMEEIPLQARDPRRPEKTERVVVYDAVSGEVVDHEIAVNDPSSQVVVKGSQMKDTSSATPGARGDWEVSFELKPDAADAFREFTARHIKEPMPIVLNNVIESAPVIQSTIGAHGRITGSYSLEEANNLKTLLNAGALPVPLEVVENRAVSPTLGQHNIERSVIAALAGLLAVYIYMLFYYRLPGLVADIALTLYGGIVLAILVMFGATLTLTGIAGLILGIGMAVDANILIFERMKEELRTKSLGMALRVGFERAWTAILDGNVTTLLAGFVLWLFGTGALKGFAVTLIVSVLASMFTAIFVSRVILEAVIVTRLGNYAKLYLGARPESVMKEEPRRGRPAH